MHYEDYTPVFQALSDTTRLKIIDLLSCGEMCACEILEHLTILQSTLSYHMKKLTDVNLVLARKEGPWVHYRLNNEFIEEFIHFMELISHPKEECICKHKSPCTNSTACKK